MQKIEDDTMQSTDQRSPTTAMQNPDQDTYEEFLQNTSHENQDICYWKYGKFEVVKATLFKEIDLQKSLEETQKLLWEYREVIGFSNGKNKDAINIMRVGENNWEVEVPIFKGDEWDGYMHTTTTDTKKILDVIRLFFDELEWFGMLGFKMTRSKVDSRLYRT